jgi:hypothetical protein
VLIEDVRQLSAAYELAEKQFKNAVKYDAAEKADRKFSTAT